MFKNNFSKPFYLATTYLIMSDDEADPELLELLRETLGLSRKPKDEISSDTGTSPVGHVRHHLFGIFLRLSFILENWIACL